MTAPQLPPALFAAALLRRAQAQGGFGVMVSKGNPEAGSMLVSLRSRSDRPMILERLLTPDFTYRWQALDSPLLSGDRDVGHYLARRRAADPDLWIIELEVAAPERFADEINEIS